MDPVVQRRIEVTVRQVLQESDMSQTTEFKVRKEASDRLKMDLSQPDYKAAVRRVVEAFLVELKDKEENQPQEEAEEERQEEDAGQVKGSDGDGDGDGDKQYTEEGDLIICKLSEKRKVTIQEFRGKTLVSIREYFRQGSKELPTSKGISLPAEQWGAFRKNLPAIEKAIREMESH